MEIVQVGADQPAGHIPRPACGCTDKPAYYAETGGAFALGPPRAAVGKEFLERRASVDAALG